MCSSDTAALFPSSLRCTLLNLDAYSFLLKYLLIFLDQEKYTYKLYFLQQAFIEHTFFKHYISTRNWRILLLVISQNAVPSGERHCRRTVQRSQAEGH